MKYYKIWIDVEEIDEDADSYESCECPQSLREFRTEKEAVAFCIDLVDRHWDGGII